MTIHDLLRVRAQEIPDKVFLVFEDQEITYRTAEILHVEGGKLKERWAFSDDTERVTTFFDQFSQD